MIKAMLRPIFKRFWGLFVSMAFVSMLSIGLLISFASTISNLRATYRSYLSTSQNVDAQITTSFTLKTFLEDIKEVEGVKNVDKRLAIDTILEKNDGRKITSRIYSFNEETDVIFKRNIVKQIEKTNQPNTYNVSVVRKFAENNKFDVGSTFKMGFFNIYVNCYVNEIIETPEGIYPRTNDYIWSDNHDFGYVYINTKTLNDGIFDLASQIQAKVASDPSFLPEYRNYIEVVNLLIPDLSEVVGEDNYADLFCNQLLVEANKGYSEDQLIDNLNEYFKTKSTITVKTATKGSNLVYRIYMENAMKQLTIATVFLPVFFYSVTMIVIGLFMNQIIKTMTPEIGVLMSIGIDKRKIVLLYMIYSGLMAITAGILGVGVGYGLCVMLTNTLVKTYSMSVLSISLNPIIVVAGILALVIFAELATFISCLAIFRITPKDATINNESKRKKIPKWLDKAIDKAPMNIKLSVNSIAQNPRRFFVSSFSIFASYVLILLSCFFYVSKNEMIDQTVKRRLSYDCQIYLPKKDDSIAPKLESYSDIVKDVDECYYTYLPATSNKQSKEVYIECLAIPMDSSLVTIPNSKGRGQISIKESGIILPTTAANSLGVSKGSFITINGHSVMVSDISFQYFHPIAYLSKTEMNNIAGESYVTSLLVDVINENAFLDKLSEENIQALTVFTSSLSADLHGIFNAIDIFIIIMVLFSLGMAFVILSIMSQNALLETKRQVSVFRAIGFTIANISNMWTLASLSQLISASIFAIPAGAGVAILLFHLCSSSTQIYPFLLDWRVIGVGFIFIFLVVLACHIISMFTIKRWVLADNLRCRE